MDILMGRSTNGNASYQLHPLQFTNVVQNILKFLAVDSIWTVRQVCRSWRYEAGFYLRTKRSTIVRLNNHHRIARYLKCMSDIKNLPHSYFALSELDMRSQTLQTFFTVYIVHITCLHLTVKISWSDLERILTKHTNSIRRLNLEFLPHHDSSNQVQTKPSVCSSLRWIEYSGRALLRRDNGEINPFQGLSRLLDCGQNVDVLRVEIPIPQRQESWLLNFYDSKMVERMFIKFILNSSQKQLTKLSETNIVWSPEDLEGLINRRFPLRSFRFMDGPSYDPITFRNFFSQIGSTLIHLIYSNTDSSNHLSECYTYLPNLRVLTLISCSVPLALISNLRSLETLNLLKVKCITRKDAKYSSIHSNLRCLKVSLHQSITEFSPECVFTFVMKFSRLKILHLNKLTDSGLFTICGKLSFLEELTLYDSFLSDAGISGLSHAMVQELSNRLSPVEIDQMEMEVSNSARVPFLGDLKHLKKLLIESHWSEETSNTPLNSNSCITDVGFIFGVANCARLTELRLENCQLTDLSLTVIPRSFASYLTVLDVAKCRMVTDLGRSFLRTNLVGPHLLL